MLSVVTMFFRRDPLRKPYQAYEAEHVNTLARMVRRNLTIPHEFVCITDRPQGLDSSIRIAPLATNLIPLGNAYPKVAIFQRAPEGIKGEHIAFLDLDTVITGELDSVFGKGIEQGCCFLPEFLTSRNPSRNAHYNTSIFVIQRGAYSRVWDKFDPYTSPQLVKNTGKVGSDQVWISEVLGAEMPVWERGRSILSFKYHVKGHHLPKSASVVCFHGQFKPWDSAVQKSNPWVAQHWR